MKNEQDVLSDILALYSVKKSLRGVAAYYGKPITHADIERILADPPIFPKGKLKRAALDIPMPATVVVIGEGEIPDGAQAIHALRCHCGQWFIPNTPTRRQCFICGKYRGKHHD